MILLRFVFGWILLATLLVGTCCFVRRSLRLGPCFSPIITVCTLSLVVYFAGLFGCLLPVSILLYLLCGVATWFEIRHRRGNPFALNRRPLLEVLFLLGALGFAGILSQGVLTHYDNFTHWALVVKEMLITHAIPGADTFLLDYTNYPTGTASWIYFVCILVGNGENVMILAQGILIFAAIYSIYGIIQERGRFLLILVLSTGLCMLSLFNYTVRINDLLVDFILPILSLSTMAIIYRHRQEPKLLLIVVTPILGLLLVVKNIGMIYGIVAIVYLVHTLVKYNRHQTHFLPKLWAMGALCIGLCLLPWALWNIHVDMVFGGVEHKFQENLLGLVQTSGGKTPEEVGQIVRLFWATVTDIRLRATMGVIFYQVVATVGAIVACGIQKKKWALPRVLIAMDLVLIFYYVGILAMYILSMPMEEAIYLAGLDRYAASIVILFGGVLSMTATIDMENSFYFRVGEKDELSNFKNIHTKMRYLQGCVVCIIAIALLLTSEYNGMMFQNKANQTSLPQQVKAVAGDNWNLEVDNDRYLVVASDRDEQVSKGYLDYVAQYYLRAHNVETIWDLNPDNIQSLMTQYDHLVLVETSPEIRGMMEKYYNLPGTPGVYDLG